MATLTRLGQRGFASAGYDFTLFATKDTTLVVPTHITRLGNHGYARQRYNDSLFATKDTTPPVAGDGVGRLLLLGVGS